jgi:DNA-binding winged helix-turn-helix (wHTH) protein
MYQAETPLIERCEDLSHGCDSQTGSWHGPIPLAAGKHGLQPGKIANGPDCVYGDARKAEITNTTSSVNEAAMPYRDEHLVMDFNRQIVALDNERMTLTRKEYELLALLVLRAGETVPRDTLLMQVWGYGAAIQTRTLDVHVGRLRKKLGGYADRYIDTVFGLGYSFQPFHASPCPQREPIGEAVALGA